MICFKRLNKMNELKMQIMSLRQEHEKNIQCLNELNKRREELKKGWAINIKISEVGYIKHEPTINLTFEYVQQHLIDKIIKSKRDLQNAESEFINYD